MANDSEDFEFSFNPENVTEAEDTHHHHHRHHYHHHSSDGKETNKHHHGTPKVSFKKKKKVGIRKIVEQNLPGQKDKVDLDGEKKNTTKNRKKLAVILAAVIVVLAVVALLPHANKYLHRHDYGEWTVAVEPTCTEAGCEVSTCIKCGKNQYREIAPTHKFAENSYDEQTGMLTYVCENCGLIETSDIKN